MSDSNHKIVVKLLRSSTFDEWIAAQPEEVRRWARAAEFDGAVGTWLATPDAEGAGRSVTVGIGDEPGLYELAGLTALGADHIALDADWKDPQTQTLALGYLLARYRFDRYKQVSRGPELIIPEGEKRVAALARAVCRVRDLVNTPAEDMGPEQLENFAHELARSHQATVTVTRGEDLLANNLPAIHAVGRAATRKPRLIDIHWGDQSNPALTLVGKGVCFDSGGLNIKGASGMRLMKKDMGGAAHVLGLAGLIMDLALPVRLRVLIPAVENAIAGNAYRPGDVLTGRSGKTMEIGNTDAEGRVVLSDALTVASEENPDLIIDFATLTGAARIALGPDLPPFYTDDEPLAGALMDASAAALDPLWRMPLYDPYEELITSPIADVSNTGSTPMGGSITAALFLRHFVASDLPWVHFDVYAWNPGDKPGRPAGGEAQGLRATFEMLERRYRPAAG